MQTKLNNLGRCSRHFYNALETLNAEGVKNILDLGCGRGRVFHLFDKFKNAELTGLDISVKDLKKAKDKCLAVSGTGERLPFADNTFDLIVEFHTLHHIRDYTKVIADVHRCLKKDGHFLMVEAVNDNPVFRRIRDMHPITEHMPIESNFTFGELVGTLDRKGFSVKSKERFGFFFEFTLGGVPGMPSFVKNLTSAMDERLEKLFGTEKCASCVVLAKKR